MLWILALATFVSFFLTPLVGMLGNKLNLVDRPNELSIHRRPVPRIGGLAMVVAFAAAMAWAWSSGWLAGRPTAELRSFGGLLIGALIIAAAGLLDDARDIAPLPKFLWQLVGAAVAVGMGVRFGTLPIPGASFAVTLLFLVGMANAMNLLDGMNGLASSVAAIAALSMAGLAMASGRVWVAVPALALAGACLGFLPHNYPRARLFMGDVGSLSLGFVLAGLATLLAQEPYDWSGFLAPILVLGLPVVDTGLAIARRFSRLQDLFSGDREHLYDLLSRRGLGDTRTTLVIAAWGVALGGAALWAVRLHLLPAVAVTVLSLSALIAFAVWLGALGSSGSLSGGRLRLAFRQLARRYSLAFALDALVVIAGFGAAMLLRIKGGSDLSGYAAVAVPYFAALATFLPFVALTYLLVNGFCGVYSRMWRLAGGRQALAIGISSAVSTMGIFIADLLFSAKRPIPLSVVLMGGILTMLGFAGWRYRRQFWVALRRLHLILPIPQVRQGRGVPKDHPVPAPHRTLIVGARHQGQLLAAHMSAQDPAYEPVGFVDDDPDSLGLRVGRLKVLGDRKAIPEVVKEYDVDTVVMALPKARPHVLEETVALCRASNVRVKILPDACGEVLASPDYPRAQGQIRIDDLLDRPPARVDMAACRQTIEGKTVLVTGAAGSIGSELCRQVYGYGPKRLVALDLNETGLHDLWMELGQEIEIVVADIRNVARLDRIFGQYRPQIVYHAAAYKHVHVLEKHPTEAFTTNVMGTQTVIEAAARHRAECLIFVSSDKAVHARNVLGASKRMGELIVQSAAQRFRESETVFAAVRFGNVLGSRGSVVPTFERQIEQGGPVTVTDRRMVRYFMSIHEAVSLVIEASVYARGGEIFCLDMGTPVRIDDLARRIIRLKGLQPGDDVKITYVGMRPGETLNEELWRPTHEVLTPTPNPSILCVRGNSRSVDPTVLTAEVAKMQWMIGLGQDDQLRENMYALSWTASGGRKEPSQRPAEHARDTGRPVPAHWVTEPALDPA